MKEINIARAILNGRKAKGITQDELAQFIGVSKASVSKWETGQSYPDITLLPQLATYFNISIDELIGYEPWMTKEDIRALYHRLSTKFSEESFEKVMEQCNEIIKKYFSCYPLLLQMCVLFLNHGHLAGSEEGQTQIKMKVRDLCIKIKNESQDVSIVKQANMIEALCELNLGNPMAVIDLMQDVNDPVLGEEVILASAYFLTGDVEKAKETTQVGIFRHLMGILGDIPNYMMLNTDDYDRYDQIVTRTLGLIELFEIETLHPTILFGVYLTGAQGYAILGDDEKALDILQRFVNLVTSDIYPLRFMGDQFFDKVHNWFSDLDLGVKPPQNETVLKSGMVEALTRNPAFNRYFENHRFKNLVEKLEKKLKDEVK
ncbi:MAG: helix-turn-helix transcriptional regulator [Firmicutes bacterium]|nr:helix-turn-helix transcriptional regulator [Bacillota bacterium]